MKKKLILLIGILFANKVFAVENTGGSVDNSVQHELICEGVASNESYKLKIEWSQIDSNFHYVLENLSQNTVLEDAYQKSFGEYNEITQTDSALKLSGSFKMWKRLGYIAKTSEINLIAIDGSYKLSTIKNTNLETFKNPKNWCNPPTRLCGSEPIDKEPTPTLTTDLRFESSVCETVK